MWVLILTLPAAFFYLGSRAMITSWLWNRYPPALARFMDCAACSGFWYGFCLALAGRFYGFALPMLNPQDWMTPILTGLLTLLTTPWLAAIHQTSLESLGSTVDDE